MTTAGYLFRQAPVETGLHLGALLQPFTLGRTSGLFQFGLIVHRGVINTDVEIFIRHTLSFLYT